MWIRIKDLGPIKDSKIELGDITVLLGPPNSGKSYTLRAVYSSLLLLDHVVIKQSLEELIESMFYKATKNLSNALKETITSILENSTQQHLHEHVNTPDKATEETIEGILKDRSDVELTVDSIVIPLEASYSIPRGEILSALVQKMELIREELLPVKDGTNLSVDNSSLPDPLFLIQNTLYRILDEYVYIGSRPQYSWYPPSRYIRVNNFEIHTGIENNENIRIHIFATVSLRLERLLTVYRSNEKSTLNRLFRDLESIGFGINRQLEREIETNLSKKIERSINSIMESFDVRSISFIPFGRTPIVYSTAESNVVVIPDDSLFTSYITTVEKGMTLFSRGQFKKDVTELFFPVLQGELIYDKSTKTIRYHKWGAPDLPIGLSSALASEVSGILLPIITLPSRSLIVLEEPEAQLHYSAQILMAITLLALSNRFNHKIIFSTHSDIFALTLAYLKKFDYTPDQIRQLVYNLLNIQGISSSFISPDKIDPLIEAIFDNREFNLKFYYYRPTEEGVQIVPKSVDDILEDVPGITIVPDILSSWAMHLSRG